MAEGKNSFIKSKMNKDLDERLIPGNEYRDATNIAVSRSEAGDVGALEAILGNTLVGKQIQGGEIIGYFVDNTNSIVYYFSTTHSGTATAPTTAICGVYAITLGENSGAIQQLVYGSWLNFSQSNPITGVNLVEDLLFWTDNRNQPRKINVNQASNNALYYTNEDQISVAKFAPYIAPEFINLRDTETNWYGSPDLKPSTMSDASDPSTVRAQIYDVSNSNLAVTKYRNGDAIDGPIFTQAQWVAKDAAQEGAYCVYEDYDGNKVTYGILYNKWAVIDSRGLAPIGFKVPNLTEWTAIANSNSMTQQKSINFWANNPGNNLSGLNVKPGGYRVAASTSNDFVDITSAAYYWTSDAAAGSNTPFVKYLDTTAATADVSGQTDTKAGMSVRVVADSSQNYEGWNGDEDFLTEKFVRFSYRFKFDDNEYSVVAPFSQDVFIPYQEGKFVNDDENQAFISTVVEFMSNSINNAVLNITLPAIDIITKYKVKAIDIIFKESDKIQYQVLESITVNQDFINALNNTNIYQYNYQSTIPITTLPSFETTRVFDKVPVQALAQEVTGNRVMYSNYLEGWTAPKGLDYYVTVDTKSQQQFTEYPQHTLKQNRNYQVGVILADKYGRQTDIILSNQDAVLDSEGRPQAGSNVFSEYKPLSFAPNVDAWTGDTLEINYLQPIPEDPSGNYPGAYAYGNYFTVIHENATNARYPYFWSKSYQYFTTTTNQTVFTTQAINYADSQDSANTLSVYVNSGDGYVEQATNTYAVSNVTNAVTITFNAAPPLNSNVKVQLLYTNQNLYKYETGSADSQRPLFPDFVSNSATYFSEGKALRGQYCDYTKIRSATTTSDSNGVYKVEFTTFDEVNKSYLYNGAPTTRPEPNFPVGTEETFATYDINVRGFYSYRFGVKQIEQDYYNVYLPGLINGYPIDNSTLEQDEIGFTTLISDNINKIPRDLQAVGPQDNQFTSDANFFPRVSNMVFVNSAPVGFFTTNQQVYPNSSPDDVELIGTVNDLFPADADGGAAPTLNDNSIYDETSKPLLAKFSTQQRLGVTEAQYTTPQQGNGNYPYPPNLGLAVLETTPLISPLELFYETSTSDLVSQLNLDVTNVSTDITGNTWNSAIKELSENDPINSIVTSYFYPTAGGQQINTATCEILSIFSRSYPTDVIDTTIDYGPNGSNRLTLVSNGSGGYAVKTLDTFYAGNGAAGESLYDVATRGNFQLNIRWTQANGTTVDQSIDLQLANNDPEVFNVPSTFEVASTTTQIIVGGTGNTGFNSPLGWNGCAANTGSLQAAHPSDNSVTFNNSGYSVLSVTKTGGPSNTTTYYGILDTTGNNPISDILNGTNGIDFQNNQLFPATPNTNPNYRTFSMSCVNGVGNEPGYSYCVDMRLTDSLGAATDFSFCYNVGTLDFTGQVIATPYNIAANSGGSGYDQVPHLNSPNSGNDSQTMTQISGGPGYTLPKWIGQIQNWTTNTVYVWGVTTPGSGAGGSSGTATFQGSTGGSKADGSTTNVFTGWSSSYNLANPVDQFVSLMILSPFTPNAAQIAAGVRPGQKCTNGAACAGGANYDFSGCAVVNYEIACSQIFTGATFTVSWNTSPVNPPQNSTAVDNVANTLPPFYPSADGTSVSEPSKRWATVTPVAAGP